LHGEAEEPRPTGPSRFTGLLLALEHQFATAGSREEVQHLARYRSFVPCAACAGSRLRPEARGVRLAERTLPDIVDLTIAETADFFAGLHWNSPDQPVAQPLVSAIASRLTFLLQVGLGYLSLSRATDSLSGGEFQRVRLASSVGSGLVGVCYLLDEPSIGLHPRDNQRLLETLRNLQHQGNTVIVVEHDAELMEIADQIIDMGPGAGVEGGRIVAQGTPAEIRGHEESLTGAYLSGRMRIERPAKRRSITRAKSISLLGASTHNLKHVDLVIPLGVFVGVTGVSGSGKSSLIEQTLVPALQRKMGHHTVVPGPYRGLRGGHQIQRLIPVDQSPLGLSSRGNVATYSGVFDEIRKIFASTPDAKRRGFRANRFSFNNAGGRCDSCLGQGERRIDLSFLPDLVVPCEACGGTRFNSETRSVKYRDHSIADVLRLSIREAIEFFANVEAIARVLQCLADVGLGYLSLGQSSATFSGGEAQRVKLATELAARDAAATLYVLDEPTTGLHVDDIRKLVNVLQELVNRGNTVLVIEHNLDVVQCVDWIIDMGPEGGAGGGQIVAEGTPEEIAQDPKSPTGAYLRAKLN
ncbi:MAG TPA: excinuclease ABC subunit UvrA, partial [Pirellulaceae bacterium]